MKYVLQSLKNYYHLLAAILINLYYGFPSRRLKVIGITGTDGKTTTTHLIYHILTTAGKKASMISSVYATVNGKASDTGFHVTTPDTLPLQQFLKKSAAGGDEFFVLETTSHAIEQNRTWGIRYLLAVLTNITHEHLDFHRTYERYLKSKVRFLDQAGQAVVNQDDKSYELVKKQVKNKLITYSLREKSADYFGDPGKKLGLSLPRFNAYNYLAAYAVGKIVGIEESIILKALASFTLPPGRLEVVIVKPFTVLVDFAHTPNGFHEVLSAVSSSRLPKKGRLIHIFGAAGRRDASKRPLMGKESATFADLVILTEEDYRDEDPLKICAELALGLKEKGFTPVSPTNFGAGQKEYVTIIDRKEAIAKALSLAKKGDVIILTGKGHEKSLCRGSKEYPWSDTQAVLELLPPKKL